MRLVLAVALVAVAPGWAIVRHLPLDDPLARVVLAATVLVLVTLGAATAKGHGLRW